MPDSLNNTEQLQVSLPVSLVIITYNEEGNLPRCIQSVPWAKEVIVVDSFSHDRTVEVAQAFGANVYQQAFLGYREQKQKAVNLASQPWVLSLDADEALSPELADEIAKEFEKPQLPLGYSMPRLSFHLGRWIRHGGWYPDYQLRLFQKKHGLWVGGQVHEYVQIIRENLVPHSSESSGGRQPIQKDENKIKSLRAPLHHFVFKSLEHQIDTNNKYSSQGALDLKANGQSFSLIKLLFKPLGKFLECYIWKRGFLDGAPGFIIALAAAQSMFLKQAKLWEMKNFRN